MGHGHDGGPSGGGNFDGAAGELNGGDGLYNLVGDAPRGFLTAGIDPGLTYPRETFGHAQAFGYGGVKKTVPKGTSFTANMAEVIALQAAQEVGGVQELAPYKSGFLWEHPSFVDMRRPTDTEDHGRQFNMPGIARNNTSVEVLAWPHAECKPMDEVRRLMALHGLTRLDLRQISQLPDINKREPSVLSNRPFGDPKNATNCPNGWFKGVVGETQMWREFYQLKEATRIGWLNSSPDDKDVYGTFLAVFAATYKYRRTDDFETRVGFAVWSAPYNNQGQWTYKWNQIKPHREVAERAAKGMHWYLKRFPGLTAGISQRKSIPLEDMEPPLPPTVVKVRVPAPDWMPALELGSRSSGAADNLPLEEDEAVVIAEPGDTGSEDDEVK